MEALVTKLRLRYGPLAAFVVALLLMPTVLVASPLVQSLQTGSRKVASFALPTDRVHFGIENTPGSEYDWLVSNSVPIKYRYHYLTDGVNTAGGTSDPCGANAGWQTWGTTWVDDYMTQAAAIGAIPVFTYYQLVGSNPAVGSDTPADEASKISNTCTMAAYWADFTALLKKAKAFGSPVVIHVEPDFWGSMEQLHSDPTLTPAKVAGSGNPDLVGLPDNMQGVGLAFLKLRDKYATNVLLGIHASTWGSGEDLASSTDPSINPVTDGDLVGTFLNAVGVAANAKVSSTWDLVFNDIADHDAGFSGGWWDANNVTFPNFTRWLSFMTELHAKTGKSLVEWQVPVGNQSYRVMNDSSGHYEDNKVAYLFTHTTDLMAAGIIAVLIGKANSGQTTNYDADGDGVPASQPAPISTPGCSLCNTALTTVSDDDGGFLRNQLIQYYASGCTSNCATHLVVAAPASTAAGASFSFTVTAKDLAGVAAGGYTGTVHFSSSDSQAAMPASYTFTTGTGGDSGVHTFTGVLKSAGSQTITATDAANSSITGISSSIAVSAPTGVPTYDHIVTILMENTSYSSIIGNSAAPYINQLAATGAVASNYSATDHPSLPNYLELTSGTNAGIVDDCTPPSASCTANVTNIADRIEGSGRTWKAYEEDAPSACPTSNSGLYFTKHDPFVYYNDIRNNPARCARAVPFTGLAADLATTTSLPSYSFITPNQCNDMHDCSIQTGDTWLSNHVPAILNSPAFTTQKSLLVIVWDEDDGSGANQVAWIGVGSGVKTNYVSKVAYTHYSFLRTIEASWGLAGLTSNDGAASPMADVFGTSTVPLAVTAAASLSRGDAPVAVAFTGSASGGSSPYTYSWAFGDGQTGSGVTPSHTYTSASSYTATVTVTDGVGGHASGQVAVMVSPALGAALASALPSTVDAGDSIAFSGSLSGGLAPYSYSWSFGDGTPASLLQNPSHAYAAAGPHQATLTATDANGAKATASASVTVNALPTVSAAGSPSVGDAPLSVVFGATPSGGTAPYSYSWNFGDGTLSSSQNLTHLYTGSGSFTAQVTLTDARGHSSTGSAVVTVSPTLAGSAGASPTSGRAPLTVNLTGSSSGGRSPYTYSWNFGDGTVASTSQSPAHVYANAGTYSARLTITDANGYLFTATAPAVTLLAGLLGVTATAAVSAGDAPLAVSFQAVATGGTPSFSYSWDFGDGNFGVGATPSHTYLVTGSYTATVTVTDSGGQVASASTLLIKVAPQLTATANGAPSIGDAPLVVQFSATAGGGLAPFSYAWSFGDGATSASQNPAHSFSAAGSYNPTLTVTDANGVSVSANAATVIVNPAPVATASAGVGAGDAPLAVSFTGSASGGTLPYSYAWSFGDGATSSSQNPGHTYTAPGTFSALLTVTDAAGLTARAAAVTITVNASPTVSVSASPSRGDAPVAVGFTGSASGGTAPYSYSWAFGDGQTGSGVTPSHTYTSASSYTATVTVTDGVGGHASRQVAVMVSPQLVVTGTGNPATGQAPLTVGLDGAAAGGKAPYYFTWDLGDGSKTSAHAVSHVYGAGSFTATLIVSDSNGGSATARVLILVAGSPAQVSAGPSAPLSNVPGPNTSGNTGPGVPGSTGPTPLPTATPSDPSGVATSSQPSNPGGGGGSGNGGLIPLLVMIGLVLALFASVGVGGLFGLRLVRFGLTALKTLGSTPR